MTCGRDDGKICRDEDGEPCAVCREWLATEMARHEWMRGATRRGPRTEEEAREWMRDAGRLR